jgi:hypothetical protein
MKLSRLSAVLAKGDDGKLYFKCPGCNALHGVNCGEGLGEEFVFDGNVDAPTFSPMLRFGMRGGGISLDPSLEQKVMIVNHGKCRMYVTRGKIQFSDDSTNWYKGRVVGMVALDIVDEDIVDGTN